jgi:lysozyme family protein
MNENLNKAFEFAMRFEGYKSDDPDDPGGRTIFGIAARFWPTVVAALWDLPKDEAYARAREFYKREYWLAAGCDRIKSPDDIFVFDTAVNLGVGRASAMYAISADANDFLFRRIEHYVAISAGTSRKYLRGWVRRVLELRRLVA